MPGFKFLFEIKKFAMDLLSSQLVPIYAINFLNVVTVYSGIAVGDISLNNDVQVLNSFLMLIINKTQKFLISNFTGLPACADPKCSKLNKLTKLFINCFLPKS